MPYRDFQVNEILTAANVNTYLMDQSVMTFADAAARTAALPAPTAGMMTFLVDVAQVNVYDGTEWVEVSGGGGGVTISATAPADPEAGALWWDSDDGKLFVYYDDGTSQQWVDAAGPSVAVQDTAPTGYEGQLWLDSTDGSMYVYYTDPGGGASSWIGAVSRSGGILQVVSTTKTDTFSTTSTSFTNVTGLSATITPRSTSSKILVMADYMTGFSSTGGSTILSQLVRGGSQIGGNIASNQSNSSARDTNFIGINYLDSPASTSALTYQIQVKVTSATGYVGRTGDDSTSMMSHITLMEVAG
jgi:hypothetical protein